MDNKKDNKYYVKKIVTDLAFIIKHTNGLTQADLDRNEILLDSVMFRLIQISENNHLRTNRTQRTKCTAPIKKLDIYPFQSQYIQYIS